MKKLNYLYIFIVFLIFESLRAEANNFEAGKNFFEKKNYDLAKLKFEKDIVFNPKNENSYLYLAKIYNIEEDKDKVEKNLETTLLIEPDNEEAILMSMKIALEKSNYLKVKDLSNTFTQVCKNLCEENKNILETLENIEPKNES